jgi:autophagy-related protein 17
MCVKDLLESTAAHPQTLLARISVIKNSLPSSSPLDTAELLHKQEKDSITMAKHLEDLAHHFGQMETALNEHEAGDIVGEEDMESNAETHRH